MGHINVAIVGLRLQGALMLERLIRTDNPGLNIVCAVEPQDLPGRRQADACGIALVKLDDLLVIAGDIDIIFDLRNDEELHDRLCRDLLARNNRHTRVLSGGALELIGTQWLDRPDLQAA